MERMASLPVDDSPSSPVKRSSGLILKDSGEGRRMRTVSDSMERPSPLASSFRAGIAVQRPLTSKAAAVHTTMFSPRSGGPSVSGVPGSSGAHDSPAPARSSGLWSHKPSATHVSVFSMTGMEAMLARMGSSRSEAEGSDDEEKERRTLTAPSGPPLSRGGFLVLTKPDSVDDGDWEESIRQMETEGNWVECRETISGRIMWYNTRTLRMVFDTPPAEDVIPLAIGDAAFAGASHQDYLATRPIEPTPDEDCVEGLLNFGMHEWNFVNDQVDCYRHKAAQRDHHKMLAQPRQYCYPEYFSKTRLPENPTGKVIARIRLPSALSSYQTHAGVSIKMGLTSARDVIKQGVARLDSKHHCEEKDFILKVVGYEEYMYGRTKIDEYDSVRKAIRNENDVEFLMVQCPEFKEKVAAAQARAKQYEEEFQTAYPSRVRSEGFIPEDKVIENLPIFNARDPFSFEPHQYHSLYDCDWKYRIKIRGVTNVPSLSRFDETTMKSVCVKSEVWCGETCILAANLQTTEQPPNMNLGWDDWLSNKSIAMNQFPRESTVCFMVCAKDLAGQEHVLAWCRIPLIDHRHRLRQGRYLLNLWEVPTFVKHKEGPKSDPYIPRSFRYRGTTRENFVKHPESEQCQLLIEFDEFVSEILAPLEPPALSIRPVGRKMTGDQLKDREKAKIAQIIDSNPLHQLSYDEKVLIWNARDLVSHDPGALPVFLRSVDWTNRTQIVEAHSYLRSWTRPKEPSNALEYLDYKYADTLVREKAVEWLEEMHDSELQMYLLQLVQALKYENYHDSALSRFLIRRGLRNPYQIGHFLFWHLKAEFHDPHYAERFGLIMEEYLKHAGEHTRQLFVQMNVLKRLEIIAEKIVKARSNMSKDACKKLLQRELTKLNKDLPDTIQIPLNPRWSAKKIIVERCRFMSSKKVPLWIVFENADPYAAPIEVMFKSGDDLRQDMLTLQVLTVMDNIWLTEGLDLRLSPYKVLATGVNKHKEGVGMMEIVLNARTINDINKMQGQSGSLAKETIHLFLAQNNKGETNQKNARENFARSCAGYCVATFVMGIGDRHSDNIMVKCNGQFFHIDFGHFLGNFKVKKIWGVTFKRERSALVFTPQMKYAIDIGVKKKCPLYDQFIEWCGEAYNCLRKRSRLLILLFALMVSAEMPELMSESDIIYLLDMLKLKLGTKKARTHVQSEVQSSLKDWTRVWDNQIHQYVHS